MQPAIASAIQAISPRPTTEPPEPKEADPSDAAFAGMVAHYAQLPSALKPPHGPAPGSASDRTAEARTLSNGTSDLNTKETPSPASSAKVAGVSQPQPDKADPASSDGASDPAAPSLSQPAPAASPAVPPSPSAPPDPLAGLEGVPLPAPGALTVPGSEAMPQVPSSLAPPLVGSEALPPPSLGTASGPSPLPAALGVGTESRPPSPAALKISPNELLLLKADQQAQTQAQTQAQAQAQAQAQTQAQTQDQAPSLQAATQLPDASAPQVQSLPTQPLPERPVPAQAVLAENLPAQASVLASIGQSNPPTEAVAPRSPSAFAMSVSIPNVIPPQTSRRETLKSETKPDPKPEAKPEQSLEVSPSDKKPLEGPTAIQPRAASMPDLAEGQPKVMTKVFLPSDAPEPLTSTPTSVPAVSQGTQATTTAATVASTPSTPPSASVVQVDGGMRWMLRTGAQEAQLQLHPESLGQVTIHLRLEGGEVHAQLWVMEPRSVQTIQDGRSHLEQSLKEQGLQLGSFDLHQGHRPFQEPTPAPVFSPSSGLPAVPARQEAPAVVASSTLNPHRIELYA